MWGFPLPLGQRPHGDPSPWDMIQDGSVSNAASLDFAGLSAVHRAYLLVYDNLLPATDAASLYLRLSTDNGATFISAAASYAWAAIFARSDTVTGGSGSNSDTKMQLTGQSLSNVAGQTTAGQVLIQNPADAGSRTHVIFGAEGWNPTPDFFFGSAGGQRLAAEANDAFRLVMSAGNIASMNYTLYGLRKVR